jgi:hemerythrin-like domain-containing protein
MEATEVLMSEHRVIERVLTALEKAAQRLENHEPLRAEFFVDAAEFIKGFADGCHHRKEEDVLFTAMIAHGIPEKGGPVGVMLAEHDQGRMFTRAMREAAQKLDAGDESARADVVQNVRGYVALLRQHILKEDTILFPMADRALPPASQEKVTRDFDRVEHEETGEGIHEKYLALADSLEKEAAA